MFVALHFGCAKAETKTQTPQATLAKPAIRPEQTPNTAPSLQLSTEELYALQRLRIQKELEEEILRWLQTRFWFVALASVLFGVFGVRALVREFVAAELKDAMRASAEAQAAAASARESIKEVRGEAGKYKDLVDTASTTAANVGEKLVELRTRIDAEGERSVAAADLKVAALGEQIEELRRTVSMLAANSAQNREVLKAADLRLERFREVAQASEAEFSANAEIEITLVSFSDQISKRLASGISSALTKKGFKVALAPWAGEMKRRSGNLEIAYKSDVEEKVHSVSDVLEKVVKDMQLASEIKLKKDNKPISNSDAKIVVFFE